MMKISLTDGFNKLEAIEYEKLKEIDQFTAGIKLMLTPPIEVRRGILLLNNKNVVYLIKPQAIVPPVPSGGVVKGSSGVQKEEAKGEAKLSSNQNQNGFNSQPTKTFGFNQ